MNWTDGRTNVKKIVSKIDVELHSNLPKIYLYFEHLLLCTNKFCIWIKHKIHQNHKRRKTRESLFTFCLGSTDVPSIWRVFFQNSNFAILRFVWFSSQTCWDTMYLEIVNVVKADTRFAKVSFFQVFPHHLYEQLWHNDQSFFFKVCL